MLILNVTVLFWQHRCQYCYSDFTVLKELYLTMTTITYKWVLDDVLMKTTFWQA